MPDSQINSDQGVRTEVAIRIQNRVLELAREALDLRAEIERLREALNELWGAAAELGPRRAPTPESAERLDKALFAAQALIFPRESRGPIDDTEAPCSTCDGERAVHFEGQVGVPGSGGMYPCPDCVAPRPASPALSSRENGATE